jgi:hypothetical protein
MQIVLTISEWLPAHFPVVCTFTAPEERLGADKQQRPAVNNGLTKRSGPSISHESSLHVLRTADHHDKGIGTPKPGFEPPCKALSQKFFDPMLRPSLVIKKERQKSARRRAASPTWCYSRRDPVPCVHTDGFAKFRFDTRCQTDPAALPPGTAFAQMLGTFFPHPSLRSDITQRYATGVCDRRQGHARLHSTTAPFPFVFWLVTDEEFF